MWSDIVQLSYDNDETLCGMQCPVMKIEEDVDLICVLLIHDLL